LGTFSSALNVIIAIPVSLVGSFIFFNMLGFTLNTFTLLALSLSIGIVVDDAIMVLENIVRHYESGKSRVEAAILGAREITPPAIAATLAILAIFVPVLFMEGIIGKFFFQFGVAMSVAVSLSLLEALTLAPMRCSQMLTHTKENRMSHFVDQIMAGLSTRYLKILKFSLEHRKKILIITTLIFLISIAFVPGLRKEMVPPQDQSRFSGSVQHPLC
jgi:HAE1 family hydrophobic/amphiphilic exporter-1